MFGLKQLLGTTAAVAVAITMACSDSPTQTDLSDLEASLAKGGKPGKPGGGGGGADYEVTILAVSGAGISGVGNPFPGDPARDCGNGRDVLLVEPAGMPAGLDLPGDCASASGRSQIHIPGDPLGDPNGPYDVLEPAYTVKGNKVRATGWMGPTLNYYWDCNVGQCNFVWTTGVRTTVTADDPETPEDETEVAITGGTDGSTPACAKLYVGGPPNITPVEPTGGSQCVTSDGVEGFLIDLSLKVSAAAP